MKIKKFISLILAVVMTLSVSQATVFADTSSSLAGLLESILAGGTVQEGQTTVESPGAIDFAEKTSDVNYDYLNWDNSSRTLTITEGYHVTFKNFDYLLALPADSTIVLDGDLVLSSCNYGIIADGDLVITGDGTLTIQYANKVAVFASNMDNPTELDSEATITVKDSNTYFSFCASGFVAPNIVISNSYCKYVMGSVLTESEYGESYFIRSTENLTIENNSYISGDGIGSTSVNIDNSEISSSSYIWGFDEVNINNSEIKALVIVGAGDTRVGTVYGGFGYEALEFFYCTELHFAEGSTLYVEYETAYLSHLVIYPENANIVVTDSELILPDGMTLDDFPSYKETNFADDLSNMGIAVPTDATILVDGKETSFEAYEIYSNNYFKLRDIAYVLSGTDANFDVEWSEELGAINITTGKTYTAVGGEMAEGINFPQNFVDSTATIYLNGEQVELTAYTINDNNFFKLRDLGEALGFNVSWDDAAQTIIVASNEAYTVD